MNSQAPTSGRIDSLFEIVVASKPYGPPLTSTEQVLRAVIVAAFLGLLVLEGWLLWQAWSLWA
jgi:hypothetical protein